MELSERERKIRDTWVENRDDERTIRTLRRNGFVNLMPRLPPPAFTNEYVPEEEATFEVYTYTVSIPSLNAPFFLVMCDGIEVDRIDRR